MLSPFGGALRPGDGRQKRTGEMKTHQGARFESWSTARWKRPRPFSVLYMVYIARPEQCNSAGSCSTF